MKITVFSICLANIDFRNRNRFLKYEKTLLCATLTINSQSFLPKMNLFAAK